MKTYRIVEIKRDKHFANNHEFLVQKRFLGFLWWYDFMEDGLYTDGYFKTFEEAEWCIERHRNRAKTEYKVVKEWYG